MTIPDFQTVMRPVLAFLSDGQTRSTRTVIEHISDEFGLTDEERAAMLPSAPQRRIDNRVHWSLTHMSQAGLLDRPVRAHVRITDAGLQALADHSDRVDVGVLRAYPSYLEFRERTRGDNQVVKEATTPPSVEEDNASPQELLARAVVENRTAVEGEVLKKALALSPTGFEDLVVALLSAMGYGNAGSVERTQSAGDAGVDGIISQDPLGLDRIYVQAKRYAVDQVIHRPRVHEFAGALLGRQGDRGVYITTSSFSKGAREEADRLNARIELIDGTRLAQLLVRYGVGVQADDTVTLYRLDEDFFDGL